MSRCSPMTGRKSSSITTLCGMFKVLGECPDIWFVYRFCAYGHAGWNIADMVLVHTVAVLFKIPA